MPRYAFEARAASGKAVRGVELAADEAELDRKLAESDLLLVRAKRIVPKTRGQKSTRALIDFCYHLAIVVEAGIPLIEGLRDLVDGEHPLQEQIADVLRRVEAGTTLSDALREHPRVFPELVTGLVRSGEESGSLDRVLHELVSYLEWRENLRRQVSSAATYPMLVLFGIGGLCTLLGAWVLPRFLEIFAELGSNLPPTTRALIWMHAFVSSHWPFLLGGLVASVIAARFALKRESVRREVDALALKLPLLGTLVLMIEMSRFAHNLGILQSAGLPMLRSLQMVEGVVQNRLVRETISRGRERIEQGATLTDALGRGELMPPLVMRMLSVGESSGRLEESLARVASFYDREVPMIVERTIAIFNMGVLLLLGATLVTVALSIFGPLYSMMGDLNG